ncbi:hypothetical protein HDU99_001788 [Rhizoclosmatium hyalinum]|nr:hypothetical protein HDU99_001788 [Rhizoclosmatium hyalinum]
MENSQGPMERKMDKTLKTRIKDWRPQLMLLLTEWYSKYKAEGLKKTETLVASTNEYAEDSNPALMWFNTCTTADPGAKFHLSEAFTKFSEWHMQTQGIAYRGQVKTFGKELRQGGIQTESISQYFEKKARFSKPTHNTSTAPDIANNKLEEHSNGVAVPVLQHLISGTYEGTTVEMYGTTENPLFKANDICNFVEHTNVQSAIQSLGLEFGQDVESVCVLGSNRQKQRTTVFTEEGLHAFLLASRKEKAKLFRKWIINIIKDVRVRGKKDMEEKLRMMSAAAEQERLQLQAAEQEKQRLMHEKEGLQKTLSPVQHQMRQKTYDEIEKSELVYVFTTDVPGVFKIGRTSNESSKARQQTLQTGNLKDIERVAEFPVHSSKRIEDLVHYILDSYRAKGNREHFEVKDDYIVTVTQIVCHVIHTLKSSYATIKTNDLIRRVMEGIQVLKTEEEETDIEDVTSINDSVTTPMTPAMIWFNSYTRYEKGANFHLSDVFAKFCEWHVQTQGIAYRGTTITFGKELRNGGVVTTQFKCMGSQKTTGVKDRIFEM